MQAGGERTKVAVLGGGPAGLAAALELSAPELRGRFEVTVYQPGWRLGGKCANARHHGRIQEHGLHVWFGFYENAFALTRAVYAELDRSPAHPLARIEDAFEGCDQMILYERQGSGWHAHALDFPRLGSMPGGGPFDPADFWQISSSVCSWLLARWRSLGTVSSPAGGGPGGLGGIARTLGADAGRAGVGLAHLAHRVALAGGVASAHGGRLAGTLCRGPALLLVALVGRLRDWLWEHVVRARYSQDPELRLFFTVIDVFAAATAGIVRDGVLDRGWEAINDRDLCEWLALHGARPETVGSDPEHRSALLRGFYDLAFAYPGGRIDAADVAAGAGMSAMLRLLFTYHGSLVYKMRAGMGEAVIAPYYELLRRRGVEFRFFHSVSALRPDPGGALVESIEVIPQVDVPAGEYHPLIEESEISCWPAAPRWDQLAEGAALRRRGVDFEGQENPLKRGSRLLRHGQDFDVAVIAIPPPVLDAVAAPLLERSPKLARMLAATETVATQAAQLWFTRPEPGLGWRFRERSVTFGYTEPLSSWAGMTQLLATERWPAAADAHGLIYTCGTFEERDGETPDQANRRVRRTLTDLLAREAAGLWPDAVDASGELRWDLLAPAGGAAGRARVGRQYWRANTRGSERYVLTTAGSVAARLSAGESGFENLVLAGDWTRNGIDGGCVEAAITSGRQAARVLIGHDRELPGESPRWLRG